MILKAGIVRIGLVLLIISGVTTCVGQMRTLAGQPLYAKQIDAFIKQQMDSLKIPALSIAFIQDGKVVYYKATGVRNYKLQPVDTNTVFEAASMTKPVFAYSVHKLVRDGVIGLDTPLYKYCRYDDIDYDERYKLITPRMVLSHTTGFPNWRAGDHKLEILFRPGTRYGYSGEGYEYLARIVQQQTGREIEPFLQETVFHLLAMTHASLIKNDYIMEHLADGLRDNTEWGWNNRWLRPNVAFSLCTEAKEYAKFVIHLMKECRTENSVVSNLFLPQVEAEPGKWSCLGLFMEHTAYGPKYSHSGNNNNRFNSNFEFYRDKDIGYVFFMNCHQEPAFTKRLNQFLEAGR